MWRLLGSLALVLSLGCAPGKTSGGLWALDEARLEEEMVYRTPQPQRSFLARQYQLRVADDLLAADEARLQALLASCPEPRQDRLEPSPGAASRDGARARQDPDRRARVARLAGADWYLRRAATSGEQSFCERARVALSQAGPAEGTLVLPDAEVQRDTSSAEVLDAAAEPYRAVAAYRLGLVDAVRGPAPLVGHLAAIYGGSLDLPATALPADVSPEALVDRLALGLDWEPDGMYTALRAVEQ